MALWLSGRGIARGEGFSLNAAGGTENHIHWVFVWPAPYSLARAVQKLKGSSFRRMGNGFSWQEGYGAFSLSSSQVPVVKRYIQSQEEHHRKRYFEQEYIVPLRNCRIRCDERYVFG
jgi:REP-associated tyrosine transposase